MNRQKRTPQNIELQRDLKIFDTLTIAGRREAYKDLFLDYQEINQRLIKTDTKLYNKNNKRKRDISFNHVDQKNKLSPAIRSKLHSTIAATTIVLLGNVPWYLYMSSRTLGAWTPFFASVEFIGVMTTVLTWIISEIDHHKRK